MNKPAKVALAVACAVIALAVVLQYGWRRTRYVGEVTCRFRTEITCFGIKVAESEDPSEEAEALKTWVGQVPERKYWICGYDCLISMRVGTPQGNWFLVRTLRQQVADGRSLESARRIALGLVSPDKEAWKQARLEILLFRADSTEAK